MGNIVEDLMGGKFNTDKPNSKPNQQNADVYSIFIQFDEDEPCELYNNIDINKRFNLVLTGKGHDSVFIFTDTRTGRKFKLFAK